MVNNNAGYVYVLMNPSMEGIIKIGKTSRDPENRVKELSGATGVPTPFILVYKEYFEDCNAAEAVIHSILEESNSRLSSNREFFNTPIYEAIKLIQNVKQSESEPLSDKTHSTNESDEDLQDDLFNEGLQYYNGTGIYLQDYKKAHEYFLKAAHLGHPAAYYFLADMYTWELGVKKDYNKVQQYLQKGADLGNYYCWGELASFYALEIKYKNHENAKKCWSKYFSALGFKELHDADYRLIKEYIIFLSFNNYPCEHKKILLYNKELILSQANDEYNTNTSEDVELYLNMVISYIKDNL